MRGYAVLLAKLPNGPGNRIDEPTGRADKKQTCPKRAEFDLVVSVPGYEHKVHARSVTGERIG